MSNETEDQPKLLITVNDGIVDYDSDQPIDIFVVDYDVLYELTTDDLDAKLDDLEMYEGESWCERIRTRLQREKTRRAEEDAWRDEQEAAGRAKALENARALLKDAGELPPEAPCNDGCCNP